MLRATLLTGMSDVEPAAWDALGDSDNPFLCHAFLHALETSGSVGHPDTGWVPRHAVLHHGERLVAAMPLYEKYDSFGEFIFDWGWARAAQQNGIPYYPKLVSAVPFTPAAGPRLLIAPDLPEGIAPQAVEDALGECLRQAADALEASSVHVLFSRARECDALTRHDFMPRLSFQFHWDRAQGWQTFDDHLAALRAPVRKQVRRERAIASGHGLTLSMRRGPQLSDADWDALYAFYRNTCMEKGAIAYMTRAFFATLRRDMPHNVVAAMAHRDQEPVAGAFYLTRGRNLYGRYWGAVEHFDALHFELCYYSPIAWALQNGIDHFEAGAQGEHKMKRGLLPRPCHSVHWIRHPGLAHAVRGFLVEEARAVREDMDAMMAHTPFHRMDTR